MSTLAISDTSDNSLSLLPVPQGFSETIYVLRLTDSCKQNLIDVVTWFRTQATVLISCFEISRIGQEHIHMLFIPLKSKSNLFHNFHIFTGERYKGNKAFSCKEKKKELINNLIYLCKGTRFKPPEILFKLACLTDAMVSQYYKHYWSDKPIEADNTIKSKPKKNAAPTWSEQLTKTIQKDLPNHDWQYCAGDINTLYDYVLVNLGVNSKKLSPIIVRDFVYGQLNALTNGRCCQMKKKFQQESFPDLFGSFDFDL